MLIRFGHGGYLISGHKRGGLPTNDRWVMTEQEIFNGHAGCSATQHNHRNPSREGASFADFRSNFRNSLSERSNLGSSETKLT